MSTTTESLNLSAFTVGALARFALADPSLSGNARAWSAPYLHALATCESLSDGYGADSADILARYALSNLTAWRGATARAWKLEVRARLSGVAR